MMSILVWLFAAAPASAAPAPEVLALAGAPMDGMRRLTFARTLVVRPGYSEVGVEALTRLLDDPAAADGARASLVELLGRVDARPAWSGVYGALLATGEFDGRRRIEVRAAEIRLAERSTRSGALRDLDTLLGAADAADARAIGRALLRAGEPARAQRAFARAGAPEDAPQELIAAIAAGDVARAQVLVDVGVRVPGADTALRDGDARARAKLLSDAGYVGGARAYLEAAKDPEAGRALADLYVLERRLPEATAELLKYRRLHPESVAVRDALAGVYAARQRYSDAAALYAPGEPGGAALAPLVAFRAAWESKNKRGFDEALEAAWRSAPHDAFVAREWAKSRLDARRPDEALAALEPVLAADTLDEDAIGLYNLAAMASGSSGLAVRRNLQAAEAAPTSKFRRERMAVAADLLTVQAEETKRLGFPDDALDPYFVSLLLDTPNIGELMGAGGLLWQAQVLPGAYDLYHQVLVRSPRHPDALLSCVRLLAQMERHEEALALVEASRSTDKRVLLLRRVVQNAIRARDARAAARQGDLETAVILWKELAREYPEEPDFLHGLGDALAGLGEYEEAVRWYRETLRLDPDDAWASLGEGGALIALGRPEEARERIGVAYREGSDPVADAERPKVLARAWRATAQREHTAGAHLDAFAAYREALELDPEKYTLSGLASLYLERDQPEVALAFALESGELDPAEEAPVITQALALEAMGRWDDARAAAEKLRRPTATSAALLTRKELIRRVGVREAEYLRRTGETRRARTLLADTIQAEGADTDLWSASAAAALDGGDCPAGVDFVKKALDADPASRWAYGVTLRAAAVCRVAAELAPVLAAADKAAGEGHARAELRALEFELLVQKGEKLLAAGRDREAAAALVEAEGLPGHTPDEWARLGGAWLALGKETEAIAAFDRTLAVDPGHVPAIIGKGGALRAQVRMGAAEAHLQDAWGRVRDPRIGLQLVQTMIQRGEYDRAAETLDGVRTATLPPEPEPDPGVQPDPLPVLPLPSGRVPGPRTWPPTPPRDLQPRWLVDAVEAVRVDLARERGVHVVAGGGVFHKPGTAGEQLLDGWYIPAEVIFPPVGLIRFSADAVVLHLDDGEDAVTGVAPSVGVATAPFRRFFATARVGTSPLGFTQVNPLWHGHARYGVLPALAIGAQTGRTPVADSVLSWAGKTTPVGDEDTFFGFVSQFWLGGYVSWTPRHADLGVMVRGGWTEGWGIEPNALVDGVAWGGVTLGRPDRNVHLGGQLIGIHHERQEDGFTPGQGGYFSPPLYLSAVAEARGRADFVGARGRLCASAAAGPQYMDGAATPWFGAGVSMVARGSAGVSWRLAPEWALGVDGRIQASVGEAAGAVSVWHQEAALAHVTWGLVPQGPSAPSLTTVASAGTVLPTTADLCRVE